MSDHATVARAEYRARGYDRDDEANLRAVLQPFGPVRLRPLHLPEAGGSSEIWLVLEFIGLAAAQGLIGHVATNFYERLALALRAFISRKKLKDGYEPEMSLRVSYDDIDLEIGPITEQSIVDLKRLAQEVKEHLDSPSLRGKAVTRVVIGMVRDGDCWREPCLWERSDDGNRYWGISLHELRHVGHIYDTRTRLLSERPPEPKRESLDGTVP